MKSLSKDKVLRWVSGTQSQGGSGGGGGSADLAGYATQIWTEQNYVNKEFFSSLFKAYDADGNEVLPNDTETVIDNIKAMFGFWTEQYVSALGQGTGGGGGGASALSDLLDVEINNPTNGQSLVYDSALSKWVNAAGSGVDMETVWRYLAQSSTQQIDISHLTTALSGYATKQWVSDSYLTKTSAASIYLSKNDAAETYLTKTAASATYLSIEFFNRLFRAYNGDTLVNPNDTTSTIDNVKAMFGFWTEQYISALGQGTGGGGGGVGDVTWDLLADNSDTRQIALSHLTTALSGYATTSWVSQNFALKSDIPTLATLSWSGYSSGSYNGSKAKTISIPDNTNQLTNGAGFVTASIVNGYATQTWVNNQISDMATKTWANGQFLKLTGGTMTGAITMKANQYGSNYGIDMNNSDIINVNTIKTADLSDTWDEGFLFARTNGNWDSFRAADGDFYMNNNSGNDGACLHVSRLVLSSTNDAQGTAWNSPALCVGGSYSGAHIEIDSNEIMAKSNASTTTTLYLNAEGGNCVINEAAGNCGIGTGSPSYKLHVAGTIYATGNVTALSDARHKTIISDAAISVEQIAKMPAVVYRWNDGREDDGLHVGSIAQYWQKVLPEVVMRANDDEGTLSMQYGVAALVSSIITARKVVNHERRIKELEEENKKLKMKLKIA